MPVSTPLPALVVAGGRIGGAYAEAAGTSIKALVPVAGKPVIAYLLDALRGLPEIGSVCVVGPEDVRDALGEGILWEAETGSAPGNMEAGIRRLGTPETLLLCASDTPLVSAKALQGFIAQAPKDADICLPLVPKENYLARFPDGRDVFVRLKEGKMTAGSQFLIRPEPVLRNRALIERFFNSRKSQIAMAMAIGLPTVTRFLAGRLSVAEVEKKLTDLSRCHCRAVPGCAPELAFDIDDLHDLRYAERIISG